MAIGFTRDGIQVDLSAYQIDQDSPQPECWRLSGPGHTMRVATSWVPVIEEDVQVPIPGRDVTSPIPSTPPVEEYQAATPEPVEPPPARPVEPRGYAPREIVEYEQPAPPPLPPPVEVEPEPEPAGEDLGTCEHLPPMAGVDDRIYHEIDRAEYRYTIHGWVKSGPVKIGEEKAVEKPQRNRKR